MERHGRMLSPVNQHKCQVNSKHFIQNFCSPKFCSELHKSSEHSANNFDCDYKDKTIMLMLNVL